MTELKKIILDDYPVENLPEDMRQDFEPGERVRVTVEPYRKEPRYLRFHGIAAHKKTTIEEAVARVRALRDEWD
ncbi:DUF4131 domain-containing protein [Aurantimonas sp. VKM B-3413]|uniref:DUF4131 domain-containing protein n=1 Tax=Aurantimonas sp. VKM B-3413 TaxID=2779401 RepID=UPI001E5A6BC2|nr:DUF4131 domain-containing protein [Aurantimonas sp. VKM B-3413]MCB8839700.1 DUF4131 domain-containing protein [Aurantimonas sp. VKM B-3413]